MCLACRFLHDPKATQGFVGSALYGKVYRFYRTSDEVGAKWAAEKVIDIPSKSVEGWALPEMPAVLTDILVSMNDKYLCKSSHDPSQQNIIGSCYKFRPFLSFNFRFLELGTW